MLQFFCRGISRGQKFIEVMEGTMNLPLIGRHRAIKLLWGNEIQEALTNIAQPLGVSGVNGLCLRPD